MPPPPTRRKFFMVLDESTQPHLIVSHGEDEKAALLVHKIYKLQNPNAQLAFYEATSRDVDN